MRVPTPLLFGLAFLGAVALAGCDSGQQEQTPEASSQGTTQQAQTETQPSQENAGQTSDEETTSTETANGTSDADSDSAGNGDGDKVASGKKAAQELGCTACHAAEKQLVGPSYQAVAKRYNGDPDKIQERMKKAVNEGASGNWTDTTGGTPMPPQGQAQGKDQQLKAISDWIAGLAQ